MHGFIIILLLTLIPLQINAQAATKLKNKAQIGCMACHQQGMQDNEKAQLKSSPVEKKLASGK